MFRHSSATGVMWVLMRSVDCLTHRESLGRSLAVWVINLALLYLRGSLKLRGFGRKVHWHSHSHLNCFLCDGVCCSVAQNWSENYTVYPTALWILRDGKCINSTWLCGCFCAKCCRRYHTVTAGVWLHVLDAVRFVRARGIIE